MRRIVDRILAVKTAREDGHGVSPGASPGIRRQRFRARIERLMALRIVSAVFVIAGCLLSAAPLCAQSPADAGALFRMVREPIAGGGELVTVFGSLEGDAPARGSAG